jgi:lycopene cyclase domain-containing protein
VIPEYTAASILWLAGAAAIAWWAGTFGRRAAWLALAVFLAFTVVFDALLTGLPIVTYGTGTDLGTRLGPIPVEDLVYGAALCLTAIAVFDLGRGRRRAGRRGRARRRAGR